MRASSGDLAAACAELRLGFDESFRQPLHDGVAREYQDLLAIRVADDAYALRLRDVLGLQNAAGLTRVPSAVSEFLGLLGVRGLLVPVYDLASLLGYGQKQALRWVALVRAVHPVGLAFPVLAGHFRVLAGAPSPARDTPGGRHVRETIRLGTGLHSIVDVAALIDALSARVRVHGTKERDR